MTKRFEGKTIIVTGAAGGIGRAAVERFAGEGANIVAVDLPGPALEEARQLGERAGARAIAVPADFTRVCGWAPARERSVAPDSAGENYSTEAPMLIFCWVVTILGACAGAFFVSAALTATAAPAQASAAALAAAVAIIPYVFTRAVSAIVRESRLEPTDKANR